MCHNDTSLTWDIITPTSNMKTNRKLLAKCKSIVSKYHRSKQDLNESIELPENHFFNKMVQDDNTASSRLTKLRKRVQNKKKNPKYYRKETHTSTLHSQSVAHFYETLSKNKTLHSMPSNLRILPLIPFWRSSFEIIGNQYSSSWPAPAPEQTGVSGRLGLPRLTSSLYVTMVARRQEETYAEPVYV